MAASFSKRRFSFASFFAACATGSLGFRPRLPFVGVVAAGTTDTIPGDVEIPRPFVVVVAVLLLVEDEVASTGAAESRSGGGG